MGKAAFVRILTDGSTPRDVVLRPPMSFGRAKTNDISLDDPEVSAQHGRIEQGPEGWLFVDVGSANGTRVAGEPRLGPGQSTPLEDRSQLMLGDTVLDVHLGDDVGPSPEPSPPVAPADPRVIVVTDEHVVTHSLPVPEALLGRGEQCDVRVDHPSVSAEHARISWSQSGWSLEDLASTNGTRVGLIPVTQARPLVPGTHLILGDVDILFLQGSGEQGVAAKQFLHHLKRGGHIPRRTAKNLLLEYSRSGRSLDELLLERRLLHPGSLTELRMDARHELEQRAQERKEPREPGKSTWVLMALALAAIVWLLMR